MKQTKYTRFSWLETATRGIRFGPNREAVSRELREHIEDKKADLMRIFPGITEAEAEERALDGMGDPEEIGKELARIHKPWLGWLWVASKWAVGLLATAFLLFCVFTKDHYSSLGGNNVWGNKGSFEYVEPVGLEPERARLGGYTFQIMEAVYVDYPEEMVSYVGSVQVRVRVSSPRFWERIDPLAVERGLSVTTADGRRREVDRVVVSPGEDGSLHEYVGVRELRWGMFYREFCVYAEAGWQEGDRVSLEFDFEQGGFTLSAEVTEVKWE